MELGKINNSKLQDTSKKTAIEEIAKSAMFAENFIDCFEPAIPYLAKNRVKLAVNAGASDTEILAQYVKKMCEDAGHPMKVAWIEGR